MMDGSCNPVDTERKLNVYKTFRRRPGRSVSIGNVSNIFRRDIKKRSNGKTIQFR